MGLLEFKKFISLEDCTRDEFLKAKEYLETVQYRGTRKFCDACMMIVKLVLEKMYEKRYYDYKEARSLYEKHGINDEDFEDYFHTYFSKYAGKREKEKYEYFINKVDEKIWNDAKLALWNPEQLQNIAGKYNKSKKQVEAIVRSYFVNVLKLSNNEIARYRFCYKIFHAFINSGLEKANDFCLAYEFYNTYATKQEKEEFGKVARIILGEFLQNQDNYALYLAEKKLSLYDIYLLAKLYKTELVPQVIRMFEPFYNYCNEKFWINKDISDEANKQGYSIDTYKKMARLYATEMLGIGDLEYKIYLDRSKDRRDSFAKKEPLRKLYMATSDLECANLIEEHNIVKSDILYFCYTFNAELPRKDKEAMERNLLGKLQAYLAKKKAEKMEDYVRRVCDDYLNSSYTLHEYCKIIGRSETDVREFLRRKPETYALHVAKQELHAQNRVNSEKATLLRIVNNISNGIMINGVVYPFQLMDLLIMYPNFNYKHFKTGFLNKDDAMLIRRFINPLKNVVPANYINRQAVLQYGVSKEIHNGDITYIKRFTPEEILEIFDFMAKYNMPFIDLLFSQVCVKYATGELAIYNQDDFGLK